MNTLILIFSIFFYCLTSFAEVIRISEVDLPRLVQEGNSLVKSGEDKVKSLKVQTGHLARSFIPKVSIVAGQERFKYVTREFITQPRYQAEIEVNIYDGGKDSLLDEQGRVSLRKAESVQKINIFYQLEESRKTFWKSIYLKEVIAKYDLALKLTKKNRVAAIKRIKAGIATESDKFEFDIKEIEIKQDKKRAFLKLEKEMSHLKVLLGLKQKQELSLKQEFIHNHDWEKLLQHSEEEHNYLIEPQELEVQSNHLGSKILSKSWYPKLDAYALWLQNNQRRDYDRLSRREREQTALGVRATWDLSSIISGNIKSKSARALERSNTHKLNFQRRELESELHLELKELKLLDEMVHNAEKNIQRSKKFFKLIISEYRRGVKTSADMLMATEKLISSEIRMMNIIKDFHLARAHVLTKLGK